MPHQPSSELAGDSRSGQHCPPCSTSLRQHVLHSWMQVLVTAASAEQLSAGIQVPATLTCSVSILFCKGFAVSAQVPPERSHLALGVAWGHSLHFASAFLFILYLLLDHHLFCVRTWCLVKCIYRVYVLVWNWDLRTETVFILTVGLCRGCEDNRVFFKASLALHRADLFLIYTRGPFPWFFSF